MDGILKLKDKLDNLYNKVVNGDGDCLEELDNILIEILKYGDGVLDEKIKDESVITMIISFIEKVNMIYELLNVKRNNLLTMDYLREEFKKIEIKKFNIVNSYVMNMVRITDIEDFKEELFKFRNLLYAMPISDENLLEVAKMKSKVQHFNTEVLEDEEMLKQAYKNEN